MAKIYEINKIPAGLLPLVGGKARGLYQLVNAGFPIPHAFIVTDIREDDNLEDAVQMYKKLKFKEVSVRSSATLEDGNDFSAAGQFSTFLNVEGAEAVKQAIRDCVASLDNETALHYQKTFLQADGRECRMTCVVQEMVDPRCAGVIFTQAPMRPSYTLVEAVPGLGENLVSGKMSAQQYRVRKTHVEKMPVNSLLTKLEVVKLGEDARRIEQLFGKPMDLEYAIDKKGNIKWLQARPITIEESVTMNELDCTLAACDSVLTTANIGEVMPGALTPLNISTNMYASDWAVNRTYLEIGCIDEPSEPYTYISSYYNHAFFNMTNMYVMGHTTFGTSKDTLDISLAGHVLDGPDRDMKDANVFRKIRNTIHFMHIVFAGDEAKQGMEKTMADIHFDLSKDMHSIYRQILDNFDALKMAQYWHYRTSYYSGGQSNMLFTAFRDKYKDRQEELQALLAGCLTELDNFESADVLLRMRNLAGVILAEQPEASKWDTAQLAEHFTSGMSDSVRAEYDNFMERHGHRGISEMEIRCASWRDDVDSFSSSMRSVLATYGKDMEAQQEKKHWNEYCDILFEGCSSMQRKRYMKLVNNARKGVGYREFTKGAVVWVLDKFKVAYQRLGLLMTEAGLLPDADAIFFLTQDEVGQLLAGEQALVKKALARRRLLPQQQSLNFADVNHGIPVPLVPKMADPNAKKYKGTPVSRGVATGIARVIKSEDDAVLLEKGEIMIAHATDIGWTPYYDIIGGLVTEIGSALSHGVVVAREYALPTIVGVENAMVNIHTGDKITIDGNTGTIFVNERVEEK